MAARKHPDNDYIQNVAKSGDFLNLLKERINEAEGALDKGENEQAKLQLEHCELMLTFGTVPAEDVRTVGALITRLNLHDIYQVRPKNVNAHPEKTKGLCHNVNEYLIGINNERKSHAAAIAVSQLKRFCLYSKEASRTIAEYYAQQHCPKLKKSQKPKFKQIKKHATTAALHYAIAFKLGDISALTELGIFKDQVSLYEADDIRTYEFAKLYYYSITGYQDHHRDPTVDKETAAIIDRVTISEKILAGNFSDFYPDVDKNKLQENAIKELLEVVELAHAMPSMSDDDIGKEAQRPTTKRPLLLEQIKKAKAVVRKQDSHKAEREIFRIDGDPDAFLNIGFIRVFVFIFDDF